MKLENVLHVATEIEAAGSSPPEVLSDCRSICCFEPRGELKSDPNPSEDYVYSSCNIYVGLSRKLDLRISLHACEAWRAGPRKNAFLRALGMEFVGWINEGRVEGGVIGAGECSDGSCLRTAFAIAGVRNKRTSIRVHWSSLVLESATKSAAHPLKVHWNW